MCAYPPAKKQLYIVDMQNLMYGSFPTETMNSYGNYDFSVSLSI